MNASPLTPVRQTAAPTQAITLTSYGSLEQMFKVADYLSKSSIVPKRFQGEPGSVLIALNMASRLRLDPFMVMQNIYDVHGTPGLSGQFAIAMLARSPKYSRIEYQFVNGKDYEGGMRVVGHRKDDPKHPDIGTAITWEMVRAEGWDKPKGYGDKQQKSKWSTMPEQMFRYRAASYFARAFCPEELMGMQTVDELEDTQAQTMRNVTPPPFMKARDAQQEVAETPQAVAEEPARLEADNVAAAPQKRVKDVAEAFPAPSAFNLSNEREDEAMPIFGATTYPRD